MTYKHTRKEIVKMWIGDGWSNPFVNDLLAQKEDKKECWKPEPYPPTPSPLDEIEKIEEIKLWDLGNQDKYPENFKELSQIYINNCIQKINSLICNQNKIIKYLKQK